MEQNEVLNKLGVAGRELDALIAEKVMGLKVDYEFEGFGGLRVPSLVDKYDEWGYLPDYSTDISAAWQVVEKFYSMKLDKYSNGQEWRCYLVGVRDGKNADATGVADTAPLAVCRAALLVVLE